MQKRLKKKVKILVENRDKTKTLKSIVTMNNTIQDGLKKTTDRNLTHLMLNKLTGGERICGFCIGFENSLFSWRLLLIRLSFFGTILILWSCIPWSCISWITRKCVCVYLWSVRACFCVWFVLRFVLKLPGEIERNNHNRRIFCVEKRINSTLVDSFIVILSWVEILA